MGGHAYADGMPGGYGGPARPAVSPGQVSISVNGGGAWTDSHSIGFTGTDTGTGGFGLEIADGTTPSQAPLNWARSFTGGAQAGYNIQLGSAVVGSETDVQWLNV